MNSTREGGAAQIVNATPHPLILVDEAGQPWLTIAPSFGPVRLFEDISEAETLMHEGQAVPVADVSYGEPTPTLPEPQEGIVYFVSMLTAMRLCDRDDIVFPLNVKRDDDGNIIGCLSLGRFT